MLYDALVQPSKYYSHLLATQSLAQIRQLIQRLSVDDLRVAQAEDERSGPVSAILVDSLDDFVDVLVEVEEADGPCVSGGVPMKR